MDKRFLESSEFYNRRYNNFSIMIIMPIVTLLICLIIFSFFGNREITIDGQGNLETKQNVPVIQGTTNSVLKKNYLTEGKLVKKGQTLLIYRNTRNKNQKNLLNSQIEILNRQINDLETLKSGLLSNTNTFNKDDQFGYQDLLKGYLDQRQIYLIENKQLTDNSTVNTAKQQQTKQILDSTINRNQNNLNSYQSVYNAINLNKEYPKNSKYYYIFQGYKAKIKNTSNQTDIDTIKSDILSTVQQQIDNLQDTIDTNKAQKIATQENNNLLDNIATNNDKLASLQAEQLQSTNQQLSKTKQSLIEQQTNLKQINNDSNEYIIKAPKTGVIHLNEKFKGINSPGTGATLAQIYPNLKKQNTVQIKAYIPSQDISSIKKNQKLRLQITRNVPKMIILQGLINNVSISPITINQGNYYIVTANATLSPKIKPLIHYGMIGKISIITGKVTFFNFYKDKLLNNNTYK